MSDLDRLVHALLDAGAYPHPASAVEHIETHISHVLLAGDYAYKLKKPVDLGFLDFSTLARRRHFCEEEIRLNGRLAPHIYLDVVPVTGTPDAPRIGGAGAPLEYAVRMRRFDQDALLTRLPVTPELADRIAERVADFHRGIPAAEAGSAYGEPEAVLRPMTNNFAQIRSRLGEEAPAALGRIEDWTLARWEALRPVLARRKRDGRIRECHGDMHRGNIAYTEGEILIFDGIEFNPALRWIDTISEIAFLVMDLEEAGEERPARRFLNRYLELTGDYEGLAVLDLYKVYRAMVRAKVTAIRLGQEDVEPQEAERDRAELARYLDLAGRYTRPGRPRLIITSGVSGSGKSRVAFALREGLGLIHLRSDLERKRLFGLDPLARTGSEIRGGIYSAAATERTYARLRDLAATVLDAGCSPLVDATFLKRDQRGPFIGLGREKGCPVTILDVDAPQAVLRERVAARAAEGRDPSEAGLEVLKAQIAAREPLTDDERALSIRVDSTGADAAVEAEAELKARGLGP